MFLKIQLHPKTSDSATPVCRPVNVLFMCLLIFTTHCSISSGIVLKMQRLLAGLGCFDFVVGCFDFVVIEELK